MTILAASPEVDRVTIADLLSGLGDIPASRVRLHPFPGTATEKDLIWIQDHQDVTCELVEGTLVEKPMGLRESLLTMLLGHYLMAFVKANNLGFVSGADGMMRLFGNLVRAPDIAFFSLDRFPGNEVRDNAIPNAVPDLAIEVLSESNTAAEMRRKRAEYFEAGVKLVWIIDDQTRSATVYTSPQQSTVLSEGESLDGGAVLPGFVLPLRQLFADLDIAFSSGSRQS